MTVADVAVTPLSGLDHRTQLRRAIIASTLGTTIRILRFSALWPDGRNRLCAAVFPLV
jgi:hypothetical protein